MAVTSSDQDFSVKRDGCDGTSVNPSSLRPREINGAPVTSVTGTPSDGVGTGSDGVSSLAYHRGVRRALDALAARPAEAPEPTPVCRFGRGLACLNGPACPNPNHRGERGDDAHR